VALECLIFLCWLKGIVARDFLLLFSWNTIGWV
jgi:hypothetical protein